MAAQGGTGPVKRCCPLETCSPLYKKKGPVCFPSPTLAIRYVLLVRRFPPPSRRPARLRCSPESLEHLAVRALTQFLECAFSNLPNPFPGDSHYGTDLLECHAL
jgi:hypothetical protein